MLKTGSSGDEVVALQKRLKANGFDPGGTDGAFGPNTEAALKAFQEKAGIAADGIAGPATFSALAEAQNAALEKLSGSGKKEKGDGPAPL